MAEIEEKINLGKLLVLYFVFIIIKNCIYKLLMVKCNNKGLDKKTKVLVFGTFDLFHQGHKFFLTKAKKLAHKLVVVVARDKNVRKIKGNLPKQNEQKRVEIIRNLKIANRVILGRVNNKYKILHEINPDIIALGFDQNAPIEEIKKILPKTKIIRLSSHFPQKFKSSIIRKKIDKK